MRFIRRNLISEFRIQNSALVLFVFLLIAAGPGLDGLSDDSLRVELATDGLNSLLERAFVVDHVPENQRGPERAVIALREMADLPAGSPNQAARLREVVAGISKALPQINDPDVLLSAAAMLVKQGVEQDVNVLEYFGEDDASATKARLAPIVNTAVALYQRAVDLLNATQTNLQNQITGPDDPVAKQWQSVYQQWQTAAYTRWMLAYSQALAMNPNDRDRPTIVRAAIDNLEQWDNPDSGVQPIVVLQRAKLYMLLRNSLDLKRAQDLFRKLQAPADETGINPRPDRFTQFNALYFRAVCFVLAGDADGADNAGRTAEAYRVRFVPGVAGDEYAMDMLHYRIALMRKDNATAVNILEALDQKAPGLRPLIARQLLDKMPAHADPTQLSPLMLSAVIARAWTQTNAASPDKQALEEGLAAAQQYLSRADLADPQTTPDGAIDASKARGVFLKALGRHQEAAAAFLDHAQRYLHDPNAQAAEALNEAIGQIGELYHTQNAAGVDAQGHQSDVTALEDRLLPLAVDSFRRYDLAYEYARRLQRAGHPALAAEEFELVPKDDPNALNAKLFLLAALDRRLETPPTDTPDAVSAAELPAVLQQISDVADQAIAEARQRNARSVRVRAALLAAQAEVGRGRDPRQALARLDGFEKLAAGLPDEKELVGDALNLRVAAYMTEGNIDAATGTLLQYLGSAGGDEGLQTVYNLLTRLNQEMDRAEADDDTRRVRELADERAALTPFLVRWAESNPNPDIHKFTYRYRVFDAATRKQAAELEPDAARRAQKLADALSRYQELQSPENVKLYQASLPADAGPDVHDYPDPAVILGIGDTAFALGNWKLAHDSIGQLLADSKLGDGAMIVKNAAGQDETVDNEQFWQAQYEFIYATTLMARDAGSGVSTQTPKIILSRLQAIWQDRIGGSKWHEKFQELGEIVAALQ
jgi:hypothetical protein